VCLFALLADVALHRVLHRRLSVVCHAQVLVLCATLLEALGSYNNFAATGGVLWLLVNLLHLKVIDHYLVGELHHVWLNAAYPILLCKGFASCSALGTTIDSFRGDVG
jgi:hypothetical protein